MDPFSCRRDKALGGLRDEGLDALLVTNPLNVTYLTGFTGDSSYLLLAPDRALLISDGRYTTQLAEECPGLPAHIRPPARPVQEAAGEVVARSGLRAVGFESAHVSVADRDMLGAACPTVAWKGARDRIERLRAIKDEEEIRQIREAVRIAERAFASFRAGLRPDRREKDLCDALEALVRQAGALGTSFPPIVAAGPRSALPHAPPGATRAGAYPLLLVDWGASAPPYGYKSDLTRILVTNKNSTFRMHGGNAGPRLEDVHRVVVDAQAAAVRELRPGVQAAAVDAAARAVIAAAGFAEYFTHSLGHGVGLQIHEGPFLKAGNEARLEAGMVLTVEPGIYVPGWGGVRIEDDVLITPDGCEVLTSLPRDLASLSWEAA